MPYMEVYLDNAATSFPKPPNMIKAMVKFNRAIGGSAGRGGYRKALKSARIVSDTRRELAEIFNIDDDSRIVFTLNCTHAINIALWGLLREGDHVILSSMEHNSVLRPINEIKRRVGIEHTIVEGDGAGRVNPDDYRSAVKGNTRLMVINHASNVCGTINPLDEFGKVAREVDIPLMADVAQTAGRLPIDVQDDNIDILVCSGHKGLLGPLGTGVLYISEGIDIEPTIVGGTGSDSHSTNQPDFLPDKFEAGTQNITGIAGLLTSLNFIKKEGTDKIRNKELGLTAQLTAGVMKMEGVKYYGSNILEEQVGVISLTFEGSDAGEISRTLDRDYGIMVRSGLHCAPLAHKTLGTFETGTVRFSPGYFNDESHIDHTLESLRDVV